ncbi:hypothetical protein OG696_41010 [Streptomyces sp. NBC_00656]|uniref:hypothetical protein n=1 Tax=Streptomyces sp. NBC_00656 TaxID=2903668 RepID=UPI003253C3E7
MSSDRAAEPLDTLLARAHEQLGIAVYDGLMSRGGPPELRDPEQVLGRMLAAVHRRTGDAVVTRLGRKRRGPSAAVVAGSAAPADGLLMQRPASVRLKYREQAMNCARRYWPLNVETVMGRAVEAVQDLIAGLEEERLSDTTCDRLLRVSSSMGRVLALPEHVQLPLALAGYDYVQEVEDYLSTCTERLVAQVRRSKQLLDSELSPYFYGPEVSWLGMLEVSQDLGDDLDLAHREALSLSRAVAEVEEASTDFRGADLQQVNLDGVDLEGIRWDASTSWPSEWTERIWEASLAASTGEGELVVGAKPSDSTVPADI